MFITCLLHHYSYYNTVILLKKKLSQIMKKNYIDAVINHIIMILHDVPAESKSADNGHKCQLIKMHPKDPSVKDLIA